MLKKDELLLPSIKFVCDLKSSDFKRFTNANLKIRTKVVHTNVSRGYNKVKLNIMKRLHYEFAFS